MRSLRYERIEALYRTATQVDKTSWNIPYQLLDFIKASNANLKSRNISSVDKTLPSEDRVTKHMLCADNMQSEYGYHESLRYANAALHMVICIRVVLQGTTFLLV